MAVWKKELPWIVLKAPSGPFTHCGLCDYLRMMIKETWDLGMRQHLIQRLGAHYQFQAAQRVVVSNLMAEGERSPAELVVATWDNMDQAKTIIPRVQAMASSQFQKGGLV